LVVVYCIGVWIFFAVGKGEAKGSSGSVVEGNTGFAFDLYARLSSQPGNLFFSPYSISTCLGMAYAGARGDTESQMAGVLHFKKGDAQIHSSFGQLQRDLHGAERAGIELKIANGLWAQKGELFLPAFFTIVEDDYQARVGQADFASRPDLVAGEVNRWVAQQTEGKIQQILPPDSVDSKTRLILADAIYFKGMWAKEFPESDTSTQWFYVSGYQRVDALLMRLEAEVAYAEDDDMAAVELPYTGRQLSMVILLPRPRNGLDGVAVVERKLTPSFLDHFLGQSKKEEVEIFLPKFTLESDRSIKDTLVKIGMVDAFSGAADFSGINGKRDLYISQVLHKARIEVSEKGTEATASTTVEMGAYGARKASPPPLVFRADHPFIFLIRDTRSKSVLFMGRVVDPTD
jgi:serpin B